MTETSCWSPRATTLLDSYVRLTGKHPALTKVLLEYVITAVSVENDLDPGETMEAMLDRLLNACLEA